MFVVFFAFLLVFLSGIMDQIQKPVKKKNPGFFSNPKKMATVSQGIYIYIYIGDYNNPIEVSL